ncbi:unnamed protein product [Caenorhabditis angaria]|uniref:Peptidase S54 rhomboid domain-containing protein n=1 Tax=Caenorhabditis angaria TaxID=860376 RepID=A0A9P1J1H5_9PELO|nr:unnamed protein product [Caenorhabditis angaria]
MLPKGENADDVLLESNAEREAQKYLFLNKTLIFIATLVTSKDQLKEAENNIKNRSWTFPPFILTFFTLFTIILYIIVNVHSGKQCTGIFVSSNAYETLIWQHLTHVFLHLDYWDFAHNIFSQIFIGIPLEIAFGSEIIASTFVAGAVLPEIVTLAVFENGYVCGSFSVDNVLVFISLTNWVMNRKTMEKKHWNFGIISILFIHTIIDIIRSIYSFNRSTNYVLVTLTVYTFTFYCYTGFIGFFIGYFLINKKCKNVNESCRMRVSIYGFAMFSLFVPIIYRETKRHYYN